MIVTAEINLSTGGKTEIVDITDQVAVQLSRSGLQNGIVNLFISGSTAGLTTLEYESGLVQDFQALWERLAPSSLRYNHDERWGDGNGYSHVRASLLGPSLSVPFIAKKLALGTWQQIILVDFDNRPRQRQILVQIMGE